MVRTDTSKVKVFVCTKPENPYTGVLNENQVLVYVVKLDGDLDPFKCGQTYRPGWTLDQAFRERYRNNSNRNTPIIALYFFVLDTIHGRPRSSAYPAGFDYDGYIRQHIIKANQHGRIKFSAVTRKTSGDSNTERLINFDPTRDEANLVKIVKEAFGLSKWYDTRPFLPWRYGQKDVIVRGLQILQKRGKVLISAYTGFGKTRIAMEIVVRLLELKGGLALVLTPVNDTKTGFHDAINSEHTVGLNRNVTKTIIDARYLNKVNIAELRARANKGEVIIIVGSVQDARYGDDTAGLRKKYRPLIDNLDVIVNDERHKELNAPLTSFRLSELTAPYRIDLSATPYNFQHNFRDDEIISRTLIWGLLHRAYTGLPQVLIRAMNTDFYTVNTIFVEQYVPPEGFNPRKWFVRTDGKTFDNAKALVKAANRMYNQIDSEKKNPLSIIGRCGLWKLPDGLNGDGVAHYIPALAKLLNAWVESVHFIGAAELESRAKNSTIGSAVEALLELHDKVVILTGEKFLTGTDIEALDHVVLFDKMSSLQNFEQLMGRMMRVRKGKELVRMYCFQPATELQILEAQIAGVQSKYADGVTKKEALDCIPLTYYDGSWKTYSAEEILAALQEHFRSCLRNRLPIAELDAALIEAIALLTPLSNNYGAGASKTKRLEITEDNDSRITKPMKRPFTTKQKSTFARWREFMQELAQDLRAVAKMTDCYELNPLLKHPLLVGHFDDDLKQAVRVLNKENKLRDCLTRMLNGVREAFLNLPEPTDWLDDVFINTKSKGKAGLVYTPLPTAEKLVRRVAKRKKTPKRVLVVNANNGAFALAARKCWPDAEIVCYETVDYYIKWLRELGFTVVTEKENLMGKKFDVAVGNPPYQGLGKRWPLWMRITELSLDLVDNGGYIAFITPTSWLSPNGSNELLTQFDIESVDLTIKDAFNVGSTFGAWVLHKVPSTNKTVFLTDTGEWEIDWNGMSFLPSEISPITVSLVRGFFNGGWPVFPFQVNSDNHTGQMELKPEKVGAFKYPVFHTNSQLLWSKRKNSNFSIPKVMMTLSGYQIPQFNAACGTSQIGMYLEVSSACEGKRICNILNSKLYQVMMNLCKYSGFQLLRVIKSLPAVNRSVDWTDEMLYEHFKLTKEEIAYVESSYVK